MIQVCRNNTCEPCTVSIQAKFEEWKLLQLHVELLIISRLEISPVSRWSRCSCQLVCSVVLGHLSWAWMCALQESFPFSLFRSPFVDVHNHGVTCWGFFCTMAFCTLSVGGVAFWMSLPNKLESCSSRICVPASWQVTCRKLYHLPWDSSPSTHSA